MKKAKGQNEIDQLIQEIAYIKDSTNKPKTKAELHKWLIRVYTIAAKVAILQREIDLRPPRVPKRTEDFKSYLADFPDALDELNGMAQTALSQLKEFWRNEKNER